MGSKIKIGVFYDGQYFFNVSNYYAFQHQRRARISISGLHNFIKYQAALDTGTDVKACKIVDAHYFRGRLPAKDANTSNVLYNERVFDDILMGEGVTTHYLPIKTYSGKRYEKGIDVWLALEAYELTSYKHFDILALIACDGDYVPLVRKINTLGTSVMLLSWDFEFTDENYEKRMTRTSQDLLEEVTIPIAMHEMIDNRVTGNQPIVGDLFVKTSTERVEVRSDSTNQGNLGFSVGQNGLPYYGDSENSEQDYYAENYSDQFHIGDISGYTEGGTEARTYRKLPSGATSLPHSYRYQAAGHDFQPDKAFSQGNQAVANGTDMTLRGCIPQFGPIPHASAVPFMNMATDTLPDEKLYLPDGTPLSDDQVAGLLPIESEVHTVKTGFGFIRILPNNLFFHYSALKNCSINDLYPSMPVKFFLSHRNNKMNAVDVEPIDETFHTQE